MAISEMPGDPYHKLWTRTSYLGEWLGRGDHFNQPSILEHQRITPAQHDGGLQVEKKRHAARAGQRYPPPMTVVEIEYNGVGRSLAPAVLATDVRCPDHAEMLTASQPCRR
jgi:hypothetical protein